MATPQRTHHLGSVLVALQFGLIAFLAVLAGPDFLRGAAPAGAWVAAGMGVALGLWAVACNRPGNFNIHPAPRDGGRLVQQGPYRWIRHPMYTAVLCCGLAGAWAGGGVTGWLALGALVVVLVVKATLEEKWMLERHPAYADYRARTGRFLPGIL